MHQASWSTALCLLRKLNPSNGMRTSYVTTLLYRRKIPTNGRFVEASERSARKFEPLGVGNKASPPLLAKALVAVFVLFYHLFLVVTLCASLLYLLARVFLIVECFLSFFHAPPGLFRQPNWGPYFPHIS